LNVTEQPPANLLVEATTFGDSLTRLLADCFADAPPMELTTKGRRANIAPLGQTERSGGVPLHASGKRLAWLRVTFLCRLDVTSEFLAIDKSKIWIVAQVDSTPIFRFEYLYEADWVPHSHIQVHGERGALAHLLSQTGHAEPHSMSALHLPTGGSRFRPNLEDVVQFLAVDCRFDMLDTWRSAVDLARARWRHIQMRAACRAMPEDAAAQLTMMGYQVTPPLGGHPAPGRKALYAW
jgi:hypothetical protein